MDRILMPRPVLNSLFGLFATCLGVGIDGRNCLAAQEAHPLTIEDALNVQSFGPLQPVGFSPDGKWLAYTVRKNQRSRPIDQKAWARTGVPAWTSGTDIWISNVETGETKNLTGGNGANWLPTWSPDGRHLAFLSDRDGSESARLWVWDAARNDLRRVSDVKVRGYQIEWAPDGRKIFVTTLPKGLTSDEYVERVTGAQRQAPSASKVPGSTAVLYKGGPAEEHGEGPAGSDPWNLDVMLRDLVSVELDSGNADFVTSGQRIARYALSPDGSTVAYTNPKQFARPGSQQILYDLVTVTLATDAVRVVAQKIPLSLMAASTWSPDSRKLSYRTFQTTEESANDCYIVDAGGGLPRNVTALASLRSPGSMSQRDLWSTSGEHIYFIHDGALWRARISGGGAEQIARIPGRTIMQMVPQSDSLMWTSDGGKTTMVLTHDDVAKEDGFYKVDLITGKSEKLLERNQCYTCTNVDEGQFTAVAAQGRHIAYFAEDSQHDSDLWVSDLAFRHPRQVTHLNPQFDGYRFGTSRLVDWLSDDGTRLHGTLLLPCDFQEGKRRYPLLVLVYGGALLSNFLNHFGWYGFNLQLFTTRGYAVLLPDAPQHSATPMLDLAKDVLPGVNKVIELGIADPDRLGVMGHSYGGYSTLALIVQTSRFKAAMEADGPGNLLGLYGEMDQSGSSFGVGFLEQGPGLMGRTPWQSRERYLENSPVFYLDRVETPLLIVQGANDRTVAKFLADEVFVDLRRLGREVEYASYAGEDHSPLYWSYPNELDFWNLLLQWFDRHLKRPAN